MSDETYNGWSNYPTWSVNLWLQNDEGLYWQTVNLVQSQRSMNHHLEGVGIERSRIADYLRYMVRDELAPDLGASFAADLLGYAFDQVNWLEIADAWMETEAA